MLKFWRGRKKEMDFDEWEYPFEEEEKSPVEFKKIIAALVLFALVYGLQHSGTFVGEFAKQGVQRVVTEHSDFSYLADRMQRYLPEEWRSGFWERVQSVLARPADPARYRQVLPDREE